MPCGPGGKPYCVHLGENLLIDLFRPIANHCYGTSKFPFSSNSAFEKNKIILAYFDGPRVSPSGLVLSLPIVWKYFEKISPAILTRKLLCNPCRQSAR
jgi:hypothetical protein